MPLHIVPVSRRAFLHTALLATAGCTTFRHTKSSGAAGPQRWALFSDTHISADANAVLREVKMAEHLRRSVAEVLAAGPKPAGLLLNGDCALLDGKPGDYSTLAALLAPLPAADVPVHMTLGNHDDRANFRAGVKPDGRSGKFVEGRHVSVIETPLANWFLLDSLDKVNSTPGRLEQAQCAWLAAALDARGDKPALVMMHHNPQSVADRSTEKITGLTDTEALYEVLLPRRQVKALFFGHTHRWEQKEKDGLHLINLPAVAYVFAKEQPSGWVDCTLAAGGMSLELRALNPAHPGHAKKTELKWRA